MATERQSSHLEEELGAPTQSMGSIPLSDVDATTTIGGDADGSAPGAAAALPLDAALRQWTRYRVERLLGRGGMGEVYLAHDPRLERRVAIKFVRAPTAEAEKRFLLEARSQARLLDEHVCRVYEAGDLAGHAYIAMQYIEGLTFAEAAAEMTFEERLLAGAQVAEALHRAHRVGLVHRDVKPSNIMLERDESGVWRPYVMDFGLARDLHAPDLTATGHIVGTPHYMSPEQVRGDRVALDRRSDVFSLGATLYHVLTGRRPFRAEGTAKVLMNVLESDPAPPRTLVASFPRDVETILLKCLEKDPDRRYPSAQALAADLRRYLAGEPIEARPAGFYYRILKALRRNPVATAIGAVALLSVALLSGLLVRGRLAARAQAALAHRLGQEVKEIETSMTIAYLMPEHDIRRERQQVRARMAQMRAQAELLPGDLRWHVHYALGRAHLVLGEDREAVAALRRAWDLGGRGPELAFSLGWALERRAVEEMAQARRLQSAVERDRRLALIDELYRVPARHFLDLGRTTQSVPRPFVLGLVAYLDGQLPRAKEAFEESLRLTPAFYQAHLHIVDILHEEALAARREARWERAEDLLRQAGEHVMRAAEYGRSDAAVYGKMCSGFLLRMWMEQDRGRDAGEAYAAAEAACERALVIDGEQVDVRSLLEDLVARKAEFKLWTGGDLSREVARLDELARLPAGGRRDEAVLHDLAAAARLLEAQYLLLRGRDPTAAARACETEAAAAVALSDEAGIRNNLGLCFWIEGYFAASRGRDPSQVLDAAVSAFRQAQETASDIMSFAYNEGLAEWSEARFIFACGANPLPAIGRARRAFERAAHGDAADAAVRFGLGATSWLEAAWRDAHREDPTRAIEAAEAAFEEALAIFPDLVWAHWGLGNTLRIEARRLALNQPEAAAEVLGRAIESLTAATAAKSDFIWAYTDLSEAWWELALVHRRLGRGETEAVEQAGAAAERALALSDEAAAAHFARALVDSWEGGGPSSPHRGLTHLRRALELNPHLAPRWQRARDFQSALSPS